MQGNVMIYCVETKLKHNELNEPSIRLVLVQNIDIAELSHEFDSDIKIIQKEK